MIESFNKVEIQKAREEYFKWSGKNRASIEQIALIWTNYIQIDKRAMNGFIARALQRWIKENNKDINDPTLFAPQNLLEDSKQINNCVIEELTRVLIDPSQKSLLEKASNEILRFITQRFGTANR